MRITHQTVVGAQHGDEGKGKITQYLASGGNYDVCARWGGANNAGHTMKLFNSKGKEDTVVTNSVPSGITAGVPINLIGPGCALNPSALRSELERLQGFGLNIKSVYISELAKLITPFELSMDKSLNGEATIGSTLKGIGPTFQNFSGRFGLLVRHIASGAQQWIPQLENYKKNLRRVYLPELIIAAEELFSDMLRDFEWIQENIGGVVSGDFFLSGGELESLLKSDFVNVLLEGAQASGLDPCYGSYPYVTSSPCVASFAPYGAGLPGNAQNRGVHCVFKAYTTRVGNGHLPTELLGDEAEMLRTIGNEFGSTTGRSRRPGWLNIPEIRRACELHGATNIYMTKVDILGQMPSIKICRSFTSGNDSKPVYKDMLPWGDCSGLPNRPLPDSLCGYIHEVSLGLRRKIDFVSVGPRAEDLVRADFLFEPM